MLWQTLWHEFSEQHAAASCLHHDSLDVQIYFFVIIIMESIASYNSQGNHNQPQATTSQSNLFHPHQSGPSNQNKELNKQNNYQAKCNLLEYHIQEALLVNKALKSELKQYRDKIEFEKKLRKFLVDRVKSVDP